MAASILIVDDDPVQRRLLQSAVIRFGYDAVMAEGGEAALAALEARGAGDIAVVILDLVMPGLDGLGVLQAMRERDIAIPVIVQTAQGGIDIVVSAMRAGAFDFVVKPASPNGCASLIRAPSRSRRWRSSSDAPQSAAGRCRSRTSSPAARPWTASSGSAQKAAASNIPILIEGESGVGKELVARAIQGSGERKSKPFVTVNCGAIPDNLVESILFGHEKGSFTGATDKHTGKFVEAHAGTLFLDEIGDLPLDVQVKLLRAVQDGEVDPVGGKSTRQGRHPADLGDAPRSPAAGQGRQVPRGPVLPAQRLSDRRAAAARPARRHSLSGAPFHGPRRSRQECRPGHQRDFRKRARHARGL